MGVFQWAEKRAKGMTIWDIGVLKVYCVLFGMLVGAYLSGFVKQEVGWFVTAVLILGGWVGYRWFTAKPG